MEVTGRQNRRSRRQAAPLLSLSSGNAAIMKNNSRVEFAKTKWPGKQAVTSDSDSEDEVDMTCLTSPRPGNSADAAAGLIQPATCVISPDNIDAPKQSLPGQKSKARCSVPIRPLETEPTASSSPQILSKSPDPRKLPKLLICLTRISPEECKVWSSQRLAKARKGRARVVGNPKAVQTPAPAPSVEGSKSKLSFEKEAEPRIARVTDATSVENAVSTSETTVVNSKKSGRGRGRPRKNVDPCPRTSKHPGAIPVSLTRKRKAPDTDTTSSPPPPKKIRRRSGKSSARTPPVPVFTSPGSTDPPVVADAEEDVSYSFTIQDIIDGVVAGQRICTRILSPISCPHRSGIAALEWTRERNNKNNARKISKEAVGVSPSTSDASAMQNTNNITANSDNTSVTDSVLSTPEPDRAESATLPISDTPEAQLYSTPVETEAETSLLETPEESPCSKTGNTPKRRRRRRGSRFVNKRSRSRGRNNKGPDRTVGLIDPEECLYEIEMVVGFRVIAGKDMYLIKWLDWPKTHNTWEPASSLSLCPELAAAYFRSHSHDYQLYQEFLKTKKTMEPTPGLEPEPIFDDSDPEVASIMMNAVGDLSGGSTGALGIPASANPIRTMELHEQGAVEDQAVILDIENAMRTLELERKNAACTPAPKDQNPAATDLPAPKDANPAATGPPAPEPEGENPAVPPSPENENVAATGQPAAEPGDGSPAATGPPALEPEGEKNPVVPPALVEENPAATAPPASEPDDENPAVPPSPQDENGAADPPPKWKSIDGTDYIFMEDDYCYHPLARTVDVRDRSFENILTRTQCHNPNLTAYLVHLNGDPVGHFCWITHQDIVSYFPIELALFLHKLRLKAMWAQDNPTYF